MIGERCTPHRLMNIAPVTAASTNEARIRPLVQPHSSPWTTASTSEPIATANSSAPSRSGIRRRPGSRLSTSIRREST
jgi:hypothetical protein